MTRLIVQWLVMKDFLLQHRPLALSALSDGDNPLTGRERDALKASLDGASIAEIAARLYLSEGTVRNHISSAIQKLNVHNRIEAAHLAQEKGWLWLMCRGAHTIGGQVQIAQAVVCCVEITGLQIGTSILVQNTMTRMHQPCVSTLYLTPTTR
ncbi:MAG TPA: LuxR C-terminal-related transcriptional regulator [Anaerolineales bacterium]|nr:LuxR C-terminal-related transcriptional regulator [Anaerolineales bacterium]